MYNEQDSEMEMSEVERGISDCREKTAQVQMYKSASPSLKMAGILDHLLHEAGDEDGNL